MNVAQIMQLPVGSPVVGFQGTVQSAYEVNTGVGQYGPWSVMNMIVADPAGQTIRVGWWDPLTQDNQSMIGKQVTISPYQSTKGDWIGSKVDSYTPKQGDNAGVSQTTINARGRAVTVAGGVPVAPQQPLPMPGPVPVPAPTPAAPAPVPAPAPAAPKLSVSGAVRLHRNLVGQIKAIYVENGIEPTSEAIAATINTIVIGIQRQQIAPEPVAAPTPAPTPAPAPSAPPSDGEIPF